MTGPNVASMSLRERRELLHRIEQEFPGAYCTVQSGFRGPYVQAFVPLRANIERVFYLHSERDLETIRSAIKVARASASGRAVLDV